MSQMRSEMMGKIRRTLPHFFPANIAAIIRDSKRTGKPHSETQKMLGFEPTPTPQPDEELEADGMPAAPPPPTVDPYASHHTSICCTRVDLSQVIRCIYFGPASVENPVVSPCQTLGKMWAVSEVEEGIIAFAAVAVCFFHFWISHHSD
jgi:hypothetical protein